MRLVAPKILSLPLTSVRVADHAFRISTVFLTGASVAATPPQA